MSSTTVDARITTSTTPNGTVLTFQNQPKRLYTVNGVPSVSVTEVLKVLDKSGPLIWWGWKIGALGVIELIREGKLQRANGHAVLAPWDGVAGPITEEQVVELLKANHLTTNHAVNKAGDRGVKVHGALEAYLRDGMMPDPEFYSEEHRGYITGLVKFLTDLKIDRRSKVYSEVRVGSEKHGYAGTFDLLCRLLPCELQTSPLRKKEMFAGRALLDLKTSSSVYDTHHYQLAAYEEALVECGYQKPDFKAVVRVTADGLYEVKRSTKTLEGFLTILACWNETKGKKA